jgi:hypothetical protein
VHVRGELYIGGAGLARGYLNKPELTRERFIPSPLGSGERLYRTGDLARWLESGDMEYLGRRDEQVKIRGYRIETGEVEHALLGLEGIGSAAVVVRSGEDGSRELVAYVVCDKPQQSSSLRQRLLKLLPEYMVPGYFVQLEQLPVTSNGKLDRQALPSPETLGMSTGVEYVAPRNRTEEDIAAAYREILKREVVGVRDSFFELGGNSIKAVLLAKQIGSKGHKVNIIDILKYPIIEELSRYLTSFAEDQSEDGYLPITYNQQRYWNENGFRHALGNFEFLFDNFNQSFFLKAYANVLRDYPVLRLKFSEKNGKRYQQVLPVEKANNTIVFIEQKDIDPTAPEYLSVKEEMIGKPFDLENGEILRCCVLHSKGNAYILIAIHHIATDYESNMIIKNVFYRYYNDLRIIPATNSYMEYIDVQRKYLTSEDGIYKRKYWQSKLMAIGEERVAAAVLGETGFPDGLHTIVNKDMIAGDQYSAIKEYCKSRNIFTSTFMICAFYLFIQMENEVGDEFLIGVTTNGRDIHLPGFDAGSVVGQFTNCLPLKLPKSGSVDVLETIEVIQGEYLRSRMNQEVPFELIRKDFKRRFGFDLCESIHYYINYIDYSLESLQRHHEKQTILEDSRRSGTENDWDKITFLCSEYEDSFGLEWRIRTNATDVDHLISERYYLDSMNKVVQRILDREPMKENGNQKGEHQ